MPNEAKEQAKKQLEEWRKKEKEIQHKLEEERRKKENSGNKKGLFEL